MAPIARAISHSFRVVEPFQSGAASTVAEHVADLHQVVEWCADDRAPALVGHSWGAMLALSYAAAHPNAVGPIVLICSGTFDLAARERLEANLAERKRNPQLTEEYRRATRLTDPAERFRALGRVSLELYSHDLATTEQEIDESEPGSNEETWNDMVRLQTAGVYPAGFSAIKSPVLMIHGDDDPHPGQMIRASLAPHLPQLEYRELARCGHYPWLERAAYAEFFSVLKTWLASRFKLIE